MSSCPTCGNDVVAGTLFCDSCGASVQQVKVARKLRQKSFSKIKNATTGLLAPGEAIKSRRSLYVIEEAVARSGFGATFRALRKKDGKQVLIKQMLEQSDYDSFRKQLFESFRREAKFLKRTKHPAFPRGYESFQKNGSFFLVMDFINGKELAKAVQEYRDENGSAPDGLIVYLGIEIADALEVLHNRNFIYRDLKPQNVMLDGISQKVKLIDFGTLWHPADRDPLVFESEGYTPPEFLETDKPFEKSGDIYSLGALLYEIATGETPQVGAKLEDSSRDKRLCEIINKCLEKEPGKRYQRARQLKNDLKRLTKGGFLFWKRKSISPVELSVLPKTLYPSQCTFCEFCGYADANSQFGYCPNCRVSLRVGRLSWTSKEKSEKEFFLYADETIVGKSSETHVPIQNAPGSDDLASKHLRIFRRNNSLWLEAVDRNEDKTRVNQRKILGPVELLEGDRIEIGDLQLQFSLRDACLNSFIFNNLTLLFALDATTHPP